MARNIQEKISDRLLLLYLLDNAWKVGKIEGITKVQKLVFLSEWAMLDEREKGFNYNFIKLIHGPYSQQLQREDVPRLIRAGLINDYNLSPTERAKIILSDFKELFERNKSFIEKIEEVNREYAKIPLQKLLQIVYDMPHPYIPGYTISDVKPTTPLLYKIKENKAKRVFKITPEEIATLEIYFDTEAFESLLKASRERKSTLTFQEVF